MTRRKRIRFRYVSIWLLLQMVAVLSIAALLLGLPIVQWFLIGVALGAAQALVTFLVWRLGREEMESRGYRW